MWLTPAPSSKRPSKTPRARGKSGRSGERSGGYHARTGCHTCKIRHVKCDENKPACFQCRKTGRVCDGYSSTKPAQGQVSHISQDLQVSSVTIPRLDYVIAGSNEERRCFQFFECVIGKELQYALNTSHTHQLILQAAHSNDAVKHAILAIGSFGEHLIERKVLHSPGTHGDAKLNFSRVQYLRAVRQLRECISRLGSQPIELILACCFLLTIFDFLCGDNCMAQIHLKAGLNILQRCYTEHVQSSIAHSATDINHPPSLVQDLFRIFSLMDLHEAIWLGPLSFHPRPLISRQRVNVPSPLINNLNPTIEDLCALLNYHLVSANILRHSVGNRESNPDTFTAPNDALGEKHRLLQGLLGWPLLVEYFLSLRKNPISRTMDLRLSLMKMNYHAILINLSTLLSDASSPSSTYNPTVGTAGADSSFAEILTLARHILHPVTLENRRALLEAVALNTGGPAPGVNNNSVTAIQPFAFQAGAIQPLYLVATDCQDSTMGEMAISMLEEAPWREGAWDAAVMARIARQRVRERSGIIF